MLDTLKITSKQEALIRDIAITHEYFPELALDDLKFKNTYYANIPMISDLIKQGYIIKKGKSLAFTRSFAKRYWDEIIQAIPVIPENKQLITKEFLDTKETEELRKVYHTLTSDKGESLTRKDLINQIYQQFNKGEEKTMTKENTKKAPAAKKSIPEGCLTPKQIAAEAGVSAGAIRKAIRSVFGKGNGSWALTEKQVKQVMDAFEKQKKESAAKKAERMKELQAKRQAKAKEAEASTKKTAAPAKK